MASHELRNPMNGVFQNAEVISGSLEHISDMIDDIKSNHPELDGLDELLEEMQENMEAVESIMLCCSHQTRIADGERT